MTRRRARPDTAAPRAPDRPERRLSEAELGKLHRRHAYLLTNRHRDHEMAVLVWMRLVVRVPGPPDVEATARAVRSGPDPEGCWWTFRRAVASARAAQAGPAT